MYKIKQVEANMHILAAAEANKVYCMNVASEEVGLIEDMIVFELIGEIKNDKCVFFTLEEER